MKAYRILIIDDDESTHDVLGMYLDLAGYEVHNAGDGAEGLALMKQVHPDIVILDVNMPVMDGFETMENISNSRELRETPVLFISSHDQPHLKMKGLDLGAEDYIVKPFNRTELLARVKAALRRSERYRRVEKNMEGDLSQVSLAELLQTFDMGRKTFSILLKETGGVLYVEAGNIVHASFREFSGLDALIRIFYTERGTFLVNFDPPPDCAHEFSLSIQNALLESMRCVDELERIVMMIGPPDSLVEIWDSMCPEIAKFKALSPLGLHDLIAMMEGDLNKNAMLVLLEVEHKRVTLLPKEDAGQLKELKVPETVQEPPAAERQVIDETPRERFDRLFEVGFDLHREQKYDAALAVWEEAYLIDSDNKILNSNIVTLRKKIKSASDPASLRQTEE